MELYSVVLLTYRKTENDDKSDTRAVNRPIGIYENKIIAIGSGIMELSNYCKSTLYDDEFIKICLPENNKDDTIYFEAVLLDNERKAIDTLASIWIMPVEDMYITIDFKI